MTTQQITELFVNATHDYTDVWFAAKGKDAKLDKQLWAALHFGISLGLKEAGESEADIDKGLEEAQKEIGNW